MTHKARGDLGDLQLHLLVLRCQAGDERAFVTLFEKFAQQTLRYLRGVVGEEAEDAQQDVWLRVFRGIGGMSNPSAFRTWLFSTTRHRALDLLRERKREQELLADVALEAAYEDHALVDDGMPVYSGPMLADALAALPVVQREILVLRYSDDMSYAEIALVVGCSVGTVRSRLHYAKSRIQELLATKASGHGVETIEPT